MTYAEQRDRAYAATLDAIDDVTGTCMGCGQPIPPNSLSDIFCARMIAGRVVTCQYKALQETAGDAPHRTANDITTDADTAERCPSRMAVPNPPDGDHVLVATDHIGSWQEDGTPWRVQYICRCGTGFEGTDRSAVRAEYSAAHSFSRHVHVRTVAADVSRERAQMTPLTPRQVAVHGTYTEWEGLGPMPAYARAESRPRATASPAERVTITGKPRPHPFKWSKDTLQLFLQLWVTVGLGSGLMSLGLGRAIDSSAPLWGWLVVATPLLAGVVAVLHWFDNAHRQKWLVRCWFRRHILRRREQIDIHVGGPMTVGDGGIFTTTETPEEEQ